jgi:hypothetical protein
LQFIPEKKAILVDANGDGQFQDLVLFSKLKTNGQKSELVRYFRQQLALLATLCRGNNEPAIQFVRNTFTADQLFTILTGEKYHGLSGSIKGRMRKLNANTHKPLFVTYFTYSLELIYQLILKLV